MSDLPMSDEEVRRRAFKAQIRERLEHVCAEWPPDLFETLVERVADISLKYDSRGMPSYDRRTTERMIADLKDLAEKSAELRK